MIDRQLPMTPLGAGYGALQSAPVAADAASGVRKHLIFVYGTLRAGYGNFRYYLEGNADRLEDGLTLPEYTMLNMGMYPGVVEGGDTPIIGEVYSVEDFVLAQLDRLEGHPTFYRRTPIVLQDGRNVQMYVLDRTWQASADARHVIKSGDWKKRSV